MKIKVHARRNAPYPSNPSSTTATQTASSAFDIDISKEEKMEISLMNEHQYWPRTRCLCRLTRPIQQKQRAKLKEKTIPFCFSFVFTSSSLVSPFFSSSSLSSIRIGTVCRLCLFSHIIITIINRYNVCQWHGRLSVCVRVNAAKQMPHSMNIKPSMATGLAALPRTERNAHTLF